MDIKMMEDIYNLITETTQGNPGALKVLKELEWYSHWFEMMKYMKKSGLVGAKIWEKYKDEYHCDIRKFAQSLEDKMILDKEFEHYYWQGQKFPNPPRF